MKLVRIATIAMALCAASATVAAAQGRDSTGGGRRGGMMGGMLLAGIDLTDAQKAQQVTIREKYVPKMTAMRQQMMSAGGPPDSASRAQMMALNDQYTAEIRATLTADQQKIFDKNLAEAKDRMAKRPPPSSN